MEAGALSTFVPRRAPMRWECHVAVNRGSRKMDDVGILERFVNSIMEA